MIITCYDKQIYGSISTIYFSHFTTLCINACLCDATCSGMAASLRGVRAWLPPYSCGVSKICVWAASYPSISNNFVLVRIFYYMKHENSSRKERFYHQCVLLHKITYTLHTFPPKMYKFLEAVTKEFQTLFLTPHRDSPFRPFIWILQLKCDGTRWRKGGEVKGKLANCVGNQYSSHYPGTWCIQHYYLWCAHLGF